MKDKIKIYFVDFWRDFALEDNLIFNVLKQYYDIELDEINPDFLFCSCFGWEKFRYTCVKVLFLGENLCPDFNEVDYAIGFDHLSFEDRYLRLPLYRMYMTSDYVGPERYDFYAEEARKKTGFCNFIYSNANEAAPEREQFFHLLSSYKRVDSGGRFLNNIGEPVQHKVAWQRNYKFSIAFENSFKSGYSTEKILHALEADTIPIYWGNPRIAEDFNPERFINCHDYASFSSVLDRVKCLDENVDEYTKIIAQPWFNVYPVPSASNAPEVHDFLKNVLHQGPEKAKRATKHGFSFSYCKEAAKNRSRSGRYKIKNILRACKFRLFLKR